MKYTRENIKEGIYAKLKEIYKEDCHDDFVEELTRRIVNYPIEIEPNILEWINGLPLSKIDCHGISIREIMDSMDLDESYIPTLIENFITFKNDGFDDKVLCYCGLLF